MTSLKKVELPTRPQAPSGPQAKTAPVKAPEKTAPDTVLTGRETRFWDDHLPEFEANPGIQ